MEVLDEVNKPLPIDAATLAAQFEHAHGRLLAWSQCLVWTLDEKRQFADELYTLKTWADELRELTGSVNA